MNKKQREPKDRKDRSGYVDAILAIPELFIIPFRFLIRGVVSFFKSLY
ncbi:hypothetical protein ACTWQB_09135 [Piscibacillus sp. B03]